MKSRKTQLKRTLLVALISFAVIFTSITDVQAGRALRKGVKGAGKLIKTYSRVTMMEITECPSLLIEL